MNKSEQNKNALKKTRRVLDVFAISFCTRADNDNRYLSAKFGKPNAILMSR